MRVKRVALIRGAVLASTGVVALSAVIDAQAAIFVARRVLGRVETMSQQSTQKDGAGYDSAAVMLEAPAKQVYATALNALRRAQAQGISITGEDDNALMVQFTNGKQIAGMKISQLGEKLSGTC